MPLCDRTALRRAADWITYQPIWMRWRWCCPVTYSHNMPLVHAVEKPSRFFDHLLWLQVAELRKALKLRSLPVSGTKTDLIERLKLYQEPSNIVVETTTVTTENIKLSPPVSPIVSKVSSLGIEDSSVADALSPGQTALHEECPTERRSCGRDSEKDKRLHEKERQIEELMRKLEQEQRLVEELKLQLEVEKKSQHGNSPPQLSPLASIQIKEENSSPSCCSTSCSAPGQTVLIKQEEAADQSHLASPDLLTISHQVIKESLQCIQAGVQIVLPASHSAAVAIPPSTSGIQLHSSVMPPEIKGSAAIQQQCSTHNQPLTRVRKHSDARIHCSIQLPY